MKSVKKILPVIDISECVLCDICVDICPDIFIKNDTGYIEISEDCEKHLYDKEGIIIVPGLYEDINEVIRTCLGDCISWDETT